MSGKKEIWTSESITKRAGKKCLSHIYLALEHIAFIRLLSREGDKMSKALSNFSTFLIKFSSIINNVRSESANIYYQLEHVGENFNTLSSCVVCMKYATIDEVSRHIIVEELKAHLHFTSPVVADDIFQHVAVLSLLFLSIW